MRSFLIYHRDSYHLRLLEGMADRALSHSINILAFIILWPLSFVLTPQKLHKVNVLCIRLTVSLAALGILTGM